MSHAVDIRVNIDAGIRSHIPTLRPDELSQLEENIIRDGCQSPLIVWGNGGNILLDGHNRYDICTRHDLEYYVESIDLPDRDAALAWIEENQLGRRNLTADQFAYFIGRKYERMKKAHGGDRGNQYSPTGKNFQLPETAEVIGREHGITGRTVRNAADYAANIDVIADAIGWSSKRRSITNNGAEVRRQIIQKLMLGRKRALTSRVMRRIWQCRKEPRYQ